MIRTTPVSEVMTREVVFVGPDDTMGRVRDLFHEYNIHHLPVVKDAHVVGMVSKSDYLMLLHGFTLFNTKESRYFNDTVADNMLVGEVMSQPVVFVFTDDTVEVAVGMFRENRFHAMPVLERGSKELRGILTVMDLLNLAFL